MNPILRKENILKRAFTMVEAIMVVAVIGILAGGALVMIVNSIDGAREQKLGTDVKTLNSALVSFLGNGGTLEGVTTAEEVLERLKTRATSGSADEVVGLRGSTLDPRITIVEQSTSEAASTKARALWDTGKQRFVVRSSGTGGIKKFVLDESKASDVEGESDRDLTVRYAKKGDKKWVWDYAEHSTTGPTGLGNTPTNVIPTTVHGPYTPATALPLAAPEISLPGGTYPIVDYDPLLITLTNPNPPGVSEIFYSVTPGVWERYLTPIEVEPGVDLETQAVTIHGVAWTDSPKTQDEYRTTPIDLELETTFDENRFDYVSLGGALEAGSPSPPNLADPGEATIANLSDVPSRLQSDSVFQIFWTFDGSDPLTSTTAIEGDDFTGGFSGQAVPFGIDDWGTGAVLEIKIVAKSLDANILNSSSVETVELTRDQIQLPPPLLTSDLSASSFDLQPDVASGNVPAGARIYYTLDDTDPGITGDGEPVSGTLDTADLIFPTTNATIKARMYAPVARMEWFLPSESVEDSIAVSGSNDLYVGGEFSSGSGMRNIARLANDGSVDNGFNPGSGASSGSVVGALSSQGGAGVLAGGNFESMNGVVRQAIARLRRDGSVDPSFNAALE